MKGRMEMVQIPGLEMLIIGRLMADIEAAASRQRLEAEARRWRAAAAMRTNGQAAQSALIRRLAQGRA
jgi:hypothetical protein